MCTWLGLPSFMQISAMGPTLPVGPHTTWASVFMETQVGCGLVGGGAGSCSGSRARLSALLGPDCSRSVPRDPM